MANSKEKDAISNGKEQLIAPEERIYVDNSSLLELKTACDEAVERILTRTSMSSSLAPAPGLSPSGSGASSPTSPTSPSSSTASLLRVPADASTEPFPPFKASHFHTDFRLAIGFIGSAIMIGTSVWSYFIEKEWQKNKHACGIAVVIYAVLMIIAGIDSYYTASTIFVGKRKMLAKRIETERLTIASPALPKPITAKTASADGKKWTTPPVYTLTIDYTRKSNGGKSLLREAKNKKVELGHLGEWFTEEGEFCEDIFEQRLISGLEKAFGQ
ncbi:uncharacterized protein FA14DRAFT_173843 [Meira miltonrushii]|uniref:Signal peptidase complex subunit 2 n=1 Tax=Meira miltonrushii TaxID=1280837 RepID=A0A316V949_9BASI|nr:uncharacterized protein FA14DRAFT_173843 [Meira miltonrushii]PWN34129.1 hypothetical protein FA14DRAFT_173843 [Meira miltonrushii]